MKIWHYTIIMFMSQLDDESHQKCIKLVENIIKSLKACSVLYVYFVTHINSHLLFFIFDKIKCSKLND